MTNVAANDLLIELQTTLQSFLGRTSLVHHCRGSVDERHIPRHHTT